MLKLAELVICKKGSYGYLVRRYQNTDALKVKLDSYKAFVPSEKKSDSNTRTRFQVFLKALNVVYEEVPIALKTIYHRTAGFVEKHSQQVKLDSSKYKLQAFKAIEQGPKAPNMSQREKLHIPKKLSESIKEATIPLAVHTVPAKLVQLVSTTIKRADFDKSFAWIVRNLPEWQRKIGENLQRIKDWAVPKKLSESIKEATIIPLSVNSVPAKLVQLVSTTIKRTDFDKKLARIVRKLPKWQRKIAKILHRIQNWAIKKEN